MRKISAGIILVLLLTGMLALAIDIRQVKASGTIYIRADGSIDPPTTPISTPDNVAYTLADDISDPVVIERGSIVVEGAGQRAIGMGAEGSIGMYLSGSSNVTLVNMEITRFNYGIRLYYSSNNRIFHNNFNDNIRQTYIDPDGYNAWDDGYPSGGNFLERLCRRGH